MEATAQFPQPRSTGGPGFYLQCSMSGCPFWCRLYRLYHAHVEETHYCQACSLYFTHRRSHLCIGGQQGGSNNDTSIDTSVFQEHQRAHRGSMRTYIYFFDNNETNILQAFENLNNAIVRLLTSVLETLGNIKLIIKLNCTMSRISFNNDGTEEEIERTAFFTNTIPRPILSAGGIQQVVTLIADEINTKVEDYVSVGSGYRVKEIVSMEIKAFDFQPFHNARANGYMKLPFRAQGIINFATEKACFKYCTVTGLHWDELKHNTSRFKLRSLCTWERYFPLYNFEGVESDVDIYKGLDLFEMNNNVGVTVYTHNGMEIIYARKPARSFPKNVNLFLIQKGGTSSESHFAVIVNLNKFLNKGHARPHHYCPYCGKSFVKAETQIAHMYKCQPESNIDQQDETEHVYPKPGEYLSFKRPELTLPINYLLFFDFETFSAPVEADRAQRGSSTKVLCEYKPASFSLCIVEHRHEGLPKVVAVDYYDGSGDVMEVFFKKLFHWGYALTNHIRRSNNRVVPTNKEREKHRQATACELCDKPFQKVNDIPTWDKEGRREAMRRTKTFHHSHHQGHYLMTICCQCNLKIRAKREITAIAHNFTGFDSHVIVKALDSEQFEKRDIKVIAKSSERFIQLTLTAKKKWLTNIFNPHYDDFGETMTRPMSGASDPVRVRIIDSNEFLHSSLEKLSSALEKEQSEYFTILRQAFHVVVGDRNWKVTDEDMQYMLKKLPFPYSYLSSESVIQPGHPLPERHWFNNDLTGEEIKDDDWQMVQTVCKRFKLDDFRKYVRTYCILDSVLLACVFSNYRGNSIKAYGLDPAYCPTISSFSWNCFLYKTKARVELISDPSMLEMVKSGIRGGQTYATTKIVTANNERTPKGFDPSKPRTHILYTDINAMYAFCMCKKFPVGEYRWLTDAEIAAIDWADDKLESSNKGYILEVDLEYPHEVMDRTVWVPLAPQKRRVLYNELGESQQKRVDQLGTGGKSFLSQPKMILDCSKKTRYTLHASVLRFYIKQGLRLTKVYRAFEFLQEDYFRSYVELNAELRRKAKDKTEKDMIKMTSNACFGKCLQSVDSLIEAVFVGSQEEALKCINSPRFRGVVILSPNLSIVFFAPKQIVHDQIIQTGMVILDYAKLMFQSSWYQELIPAFSRGLQDVKLLYTDTDGVILEITDPENTFLDSLYEARHLLDFSKVPKDTDLLKKYPELIGFNDSKPGVWKVESLSIYSACFIRPKMYSLLFFSNETDRKAKGLTKACIRNITHDDYLKVVTENKIIRLPMRCIRSTEHSVYNIEIDKLGYHSLDISRAYHDSNDYNVSLPYFHHKLYNCNCTEC